MWKLLIDARTKKRREEERANKIGRKEKVKREHSEYVKELERRSKEEDVNVNTNVKFYFNANRV